MGFKSNGPSAIALSSHPTQLPFKSVKNDSTLLGAYNEGNLADAKKH